MARRQVLHNRGLHLSTANASRLWAFIGGSSWLAGDHGNGAGRDAALAWRARPTDESCAATCGDFTTAPKDMAILQPPFAAGLNRLRTCDAATSSGSQNRFTSNGLIARRAAAVVATAAAHTSTSSPKAATRPSPACSRRWRRRTGQLHSTPIEATFTVGGGGRSSSRIALKRRRGVLAPANDRIWAPTGVKLQPRGCTAPAEEVLVLGLRKSRALTRAPRALLGVILIRVPLEQVALTHGGEAAADDGGAPAADDAVALDRRLGMVVA